MKKYIYLFLSIFLIIVSCQNGPSTPTTTIGTDDTTTTTTTINSPIVTNKITNLQDVINSVQPGATINLSEYSDLSNYNATIDKNLTIMDTSSHDLLNGTLTISKDGVVLSNIANVNVATTSNLGAGSLKISNSLLNTLVLNGGGSNSIHLSGTTVIDATADYEGVRIVFDDKNSSITNLSASSFCKIDVEQTNDPTIQLVTNLKINENSLVDLKAVIGNVNVLGANARLNLSEHSSSFTGLADIANNLLNSFKLITVEEVKLPQSIDTTTLSKINNKTSHSIKPSSDVTSDPWSSIEFNYEELLKAWKTNKENGYAGTDFWENYQNLRILDKNNLDEITGIRSHGLQMCEWLTSVDIGENVSKIGKHVFLGCHNITKVIVRATEPPLLEGKLFYAVGDDTSDVAIDTDLFSYANKNISAECIDLAIEFFSSQSAEDKGDISEISQTLSDCNEALNKFKENQDSLLYLMLTQQGINFDSIGKFLKSYEALESIIGVLRIYQENEQIDASINLDYCDPQFFLNKIISSYKIIPSDLNNITIYVPKGCKGKYENADYWKLYKIEEMD